MKEVLRNVGVWVCGRVARVDNTGTCSNGVHWSRWSDIGRSDWSRLTEVGCSSLLPVGPGSPVHLRLLPPLPGGWVTLDTCPTTRLRSRAPGSAGLLSPP
jgi:hypothetical protein